MLKNASSVVIHWGWGRWWIIRWQRHVWGDETISIEPNQNENFFLQATDPRRVSITKYERARSVNSTWSRVLPQATISHRTSTYSPVIRTRIVDGEMSSCTFSIGLRHPLLSRLVFERLGGCPNASSPSWPSGRVSRIIDGGENSTDESPISDLLFKIKRTLNLCIKADYYKKCTGVSGRKWIESHPIPGTWMFPGVLHVAWRALRAFLGVFVDEALDKASAVLDGTFSLPTARTLEVAHERDEPEFIDLLSVIYPLSCKLWNERNYVKQL